MSEEILKLSDDTIAAIAAGVRYSILTGTPIGKNLRDLEFVVDDGEIEAKELPHEWSIEKLEEILEEGLD